MCTSTEVHAEGQRTFRQGPSVGPIDSCFRSRREHCVSDRSFSIAAFILIRLRISASLAIFTETAMPSLAHS